MICFNQVVASCAQSYMLNYTFMSLKSLLLLLGPHMLEY